MKEAICTATGAVGGCIASFFGGWGVTVLVLILFMGIDYITGLIVAGVFKKSPKTPNGALESRAALKGLCRKGAVLVILLVATGLDTVLGFNYITNAVAVGFICSEAISITENAALMGVPMPKQIGKAIDILKNKNEEDNKNE